MTTAQPLLSSFRTDQKRRPLHIETQSHVLDSTSLYLEKRLSNLQYGTDSIMAHGCRADNPSPGWGCLVGGQFERLGLPISGRLAGRFGLPSAAWPEPFLQTPSPHFNCMSSSKALVRDLASLVLHHSYKNIPVLPRLGLVVYCRSLMLRRCFWRPVRSKSPAR